MFYKSPAHCFLRVLPAFKKGVIFGLDIFLQNNTGIYEIKKKAEDALNIIVIESSKAFTEFQ